MPNEQGIGSTALMQRSRVYHGTSEVESPDGLLAEDLVPGLDGMLHVHTEEEPVQRSYGLVVPVMLAADVDQLLALPDLRDWHPCKLAVALEEAGVIPPAERLALEAGIAEAGLARTLDLEQLRAELEEGMGIEHEYRHTPDIGYLAAESLDAWDETDGRPESRTGLTLNDVQLAGAALRELLGLRAALYAALVERGVRAFRYRNAYERELKGGWSVAVIDLGMVATA